MKRILSRWVGDEALTRLVEPATIESPYSRAVVVGYGPVGQTLTHILREFHIDPVIVDLNVDTIRRLRAEGSRAVYGDANSAEILEAAGIQSAEFLLLTLTEPSSRYPVIKTALALKPTIRIIARARYVSERGTIHDLGLKAAAYEEVEVAVALAEMLLQNIGVHEEVVRQRSKAIREELSLEPCESSCYVASKPPK